MTSYPSIDRDEAKRVDAIVQQVRDAGLTEAADLFSTTYWGWLRLTSAYVLGHPYVSQPDPGMTPLSALHVVDYTFKRWAPQIPGTPMLDDDRVREAADDDEAWHRAEARRMRIAAGDDFGDVEPDDTYYDDWDDSE